MFASQSPRTCAWSWMPKDARPLFEQSIQTATFERSCKPHTTTHPGALRLTLTELITTTISARIPTPFAKKIATLDESGLDGAVRRELARQNNAALLTGTQHDHSRVTADPEMIKRAKDAQTEDVKVTTRFRAGEAESNVHLQVRNVAKSNRGTLPERKS